MSGLPANTFTMQLEGEQFQNLAHDQQRVTARFFSGMRLHAVAGIGDPGRFFAHLRSLGLSFVAHAFKDHHAFCAGDLDFPDCDAVLMTQKDAIKCAAFASETWWALPVEARIDNTLLALITRKIGSASGR